MKMQRLALIAGFLTAALVGLIVIKHLQLAAHPHVLQQFAKADRVDLCWQDTPEITVTGDEAQEIVNVVTTSKQFFGPKGTPPTFGIFLLDEVRFYRGTNYLGKIYTSAELISTDFSDGYKADYTKMEALVDEPINKAVREDPRFKVSSTQPSK